MAGPSGWSVRERAYFPDSEVIDFTTADGKAHTHGLYRECGVGQLQLPIPVHCHGVPVWVVAVTNSSGCRQIITVGATDGRYLGRGMSC